MNAAMRASATWYTLARFRDRKAEPRATSGLWAALRSAARFAGRERAVPVLADGIAGDAKINEAFLTGPGRLNVRVLLSARSPPCWALALSLC